MILYLNIIENIHDVIDAKYCLTNRLNEPVFTLKWLVTTSHNKTGFFGRKDSVRKKHTWL